MEAGIIESKVAIYWTPWVTAVWTLCGEVRNIAMDSTAGNVVSRGRIDLGRADTDRFLRFQGE